MPEESFSVRDLGIVLARILGLKEGDVAEIQKDKTDPNRVLVLRHPS